MELAYHASHEQFDPARLLQLAINAEKAGFDAIHSSDHFHPWSVRQGQSGFSWSWLGAAMQATALPFSVVCAPGQRYHPAVVAQAMATLAVMFPGRLSVELGTGEALNECITGAGWPSKADRQYRLRECFNIIRSLLQGEEITYNGLVQVENARLYTLPAEHIPLFGAAISLKTSVWMAAWADGLLSILDDTVDQLRHKIDGFTSCGGAGKPIYVQCYFSYHPREDLALSEAMHQWRTNVLSPDELGNITTPYAFDKGAAHITEADIKSKVRIFTSMEGLFQLIEQLSECGIRRLILHNVGRNQEMFIQDFGIYKKEKNQR